MTRYYRIAGLTVQMDAGGRTEAQARPYLTDPAPADIVIAADPRPLQEAQPHLSPDDCEYLATGGDFYRQLLEHDGLLIHASAVVMDGAAYLFSGPCGTGKSTHTRLWREVFGDRAVMVNDDKVFLQLRQDGVWAYGSPWTGKHGIGNNISAPLKGICFLQRGTENHIQKAEPENWLAELIHQCFLPEERYVSLVQQLAQRIPLWEMACTKDPQAANVAYEAMSSVM